MNKPGKKGWLSRWLSGNRPQKMLFLFYRRGSVAIRYNRFPKKKRKKHRLRTIIHTGLVFPGSEFAQTSLTKSLSAIVGIDYPISGISLRRRWGNNSPRNRMIFFKHLFVNIYVKQKHVCIQILCKSVCKFFILSIFFLARAIVNEILRTISPRLDIR